MSGVMSSFTFHVGLLAVVDGLWNSVLDPRTFLLHASGTIDVSMASPKARAVHFPFHACDGILSQFSEFSFMSAAPRRSPDVEFPNTLPSVKLGRQYTYRSSPRSAVTLSLHFWGNEASGSRSPRLISDPVFEGTVRSSRGTHGYRLHW
ncbi:hypothetical protein NW759_004074 [Fusarium solani]|nr:hypothetical protein NW759_004074 [Fusarium solani]